MRYQTIIIWSDGSKTVESFETEDAAHECENIFKMAFGNQVVFTCVNRLL